MATNTTTTPSPFIRTPSVGWVKTDAAAAAVARQGTSERGGGVGAGRAVPAAGTCGGGVPRAGGQGVDTSTARRGGGERSPLASSVPLRPPPPVFPRPLCLFQSLPFRLRRSRPHPRSRDRHGGWWKNKHAHKSQHRRDNGWTRGPTLPPAPPPRRVPAFDMPRGGAGGGNQAGILRALWGWGAAGSSHHHHYNHLRSPRKTCVGPLLLECSSMPGARKKKGVVHWGEGGRRWVVGGLRRRSRRRPRGGFSLVESPPLAGGALAAARRGGGRRGRAPRGGAATRPLSSDVAPRGRRPAPGEPDFALTGRRGGDAGAPTCRGASAGPFACRSGGEEMGGWHCGTPAHTPGH